MCHTRIEVLEYVEILLPLVYLLHTLCVDPHWLLAFIALPLYLEELYLIPQYIQDFLIFHPLSKAELSILLDLLQLFPDIINIRLDGEHILISQQCSQKAILILMNFHLLTLSKHLRLPII